VLEAETCASAAAARKGRALMATVEILRVGGGHEVHELPRHRLLQAIQRLIGCTCCDVVNLRDGRVMLVDDTGLVDGKPTNDAATAIYRRKAPSSPYPIAGDVAIAHDKDFS
jgi:hypothetical protein